MTQIAEKNAALWQLRVDSTTHHRAADIATQAQIKRDTSAANAKAAGASLSEIALALDLCRSSAQAVVARGYRKHNVTQ
jgi:hypothetical protein